jgi:dihydroorotate dehydrogenase
MPKNELVFSNPILNSSGTLGFAPDSRGPVSLSSLGAFITNPISLRRRAATAQPRVLAFSGGFLLHTGLPNPGLQSIIQTYGRRWAVSPLPIIVHIMADRPDEARVMVRELESLDNVMALELGFAPMLSDDLVVISVEQSQGELPLIVNLASDKILELGHRALQAGAAAVSMATPRGALPAEPGFISGRLYGPALLPAALSIVRAAAAAGIPVIAHGGACTPAEVDAMLSGGALAVELDARLWIPS